MRAIMAIAATTVGEAIRRKVLLIILLIGVLFLAVAPGLNTLSTQSETTVLKGMVLGIVQLTSAVIAIVLTVYMIPNEIERRTIYTIVSKPVQRWQFLIGKYLGAVGALGIMMLLMSLVMEITFFLQFQSGFKAEDALDLLRAPAMFFVQMSLLAAVAICFSTFVTPLVNFFLSGGLYLIGSLFAPFFDSLNQNSSTPMFAKLTARFVGVVLPNFSIYNVQNPIINPGQTIQNPTTYYMQVTGYGVLYIGLLLVLGIVILDRLEV